MLFSFVLSWRAGNGGFIEEGATLLHGQAPKDGNAAVHCEGERDKGQPYSASKKCMLVMEAPCGASIKTACTAATVRCCACSAWRCPEAC